MAEVQVPKVEVDKVLLLPGVHSVLVEPATKFWSTELSNCDPSEEPAEMDDQEWWELDNVGLLADLPSPLAEITLELIDPLLLQIHLQTLPETGPVQTKNERNVRSEAMSLTY